MGDRITNIFERMKDGEITNLEELHDIVHFALDIKEENFTTANSDYTAALFETIVKMSPSYINNDGETVVSLTKERLNAALKAAQHCV